MESQDGKFNQPWPSPGQQSAGRPDDTLPVRCFAQEMVLTIRRLQWLKDKVIISGGEANDVVLSVYDWVELVKEEKEAV